MRINDAGRAILETFEVCRLEAHQDAAGVWTIGRGHVGQHVKPGAKITQHQADTILEYDLQRYEDAVALFAPKANANQASALVCLVFSVGVETFRKSALLNFLNKGLPVAAAAQFAKFPGPPKRRAAEAALFMAAVH